MGGNYIVHACRFPQIPLVLASLAGAGFTRRHTENHGATRRKLQPSDPVSMNLDSLLFPQSHTHKGSSDTIGYENKKPPCNSVILRATAEFGRAKRVLSGIRKKSLQIFQVFLPLLLQLLEERWRQACNFLELIGKVGYAAVVQLVGNLSQVKFIVQ